MIVKVGTAKEDWMTVDLCAEIAYKLLVSLPRSRLATIQRRIAPLLQFDVVGVCANLWRLQKQTNVRIDSANGGWPADLLLSVLSKPAHLCPGLQSLARACERSKPLEVPLPSPRLEVATSFKGCTIDTASNAGMGSVG